MTKKNEAEYDPSLTQFLIDNGFTNKLVPLIPLRGSWVLPADPKCPDCHNVTDTVREMRQMFESGCIFTLPGNLGLGPWVDYVFYTPISSDEIRRKVALKAFL